MNNQERRYGVCERNSLLPFRYSILTDIYSHWKMVKMLKMPYAEKENMLQRGVMESCHCTSVHVLLAYRSHTHHNGKPNAWIKGHM